MSASTPMEDRQDATIGASAFTMGVSQLIANDFPDRAANVSDIKILPGKIDMIPYRAVMSLKFWAPDEQKLNRLENALLQRGRSEAEKSRLGFETKLLDKHTPITLSQEFQKAIVRAAQTVGLSYTQITAMANYDCQSLANICPAGMILIPSIKGISHSPQEFPHWNDCINGANVLLQAVLEFCSQHQ